ncbi:MAG: 5-methyltetrahydropteroyltriglutamate--homocysteine S-methyltransferase [Proteobacteria bacterium]|jgi:5-methyltetrahydropteroyltriglutamate--homocysteine methyltransferase|nr:5-methyltetrahydropteroyltriglutamate--homocysteine S-methyltransferase [Pseudomonadota bacterium]
MTVTIANLGFPRIGARRELKFALESHWAGKTGEDELKETAQALRARHWQAQQAAGIAVIPSNDFSLYDHVLDLAVALGAVPEGYGWSGEGPVSLATYFALARGGAIADGCDCGCPDKGVSALEMTKWFDTNYHYMVPEFSETQAFRLTANKALAEFNEARALGIHTRPVIVGPVTFLKLGKGATPGLRPLSLLSALLPVYARMLGELHAAGADWVQIDEPALSLDLDEAEQAAFAKAYAYLAEAVPGLKIMLANYFGGYGENLTVATRLPVAGLHFDLVSAREELEHIAISARRNLVFSLGVISGRNVWKADLAAIHHRIAPIVEKRGADHVQIAPSTSLLHVPVDLALETDLEPAVKARLSFAAQKLEELRTLGAALAQGRAPVDAGRTAPLTDPAVKARLAAVTSADESRATPFAERRTLQEKRFGLPLFPTTTIGSFPQTAEVRQARAAFTKGTLSPADYDAFLHRETEAAIRWQEEIGIDVLVHGEFERNDMVQYFGEQLSGYAFTRHGWVQSYGSRYVRPPVIHSDVSRPEPMTVAWARFAASLTQRPVKGMLTGPVTMLQWSFVRDDIPRETVCRQIALALRDEVCDLEAAGIGIIQIDEPALREGLPLRKADWPAYLDWATACFRLSASGIGDATQIHTHMCYAEFNDIIDAIIAMDADVISIETSRSRMELLDAFLTHHYPSGIGPGVYDIHSPRVPETGEMVALLEKAVIRLAPEQVWVNPDCGLKTRRWEEVKPALENMVAAAEKLRALFSGRTTGRRSA